MDKYMFEKILTLRKRELLEDIFLYLITDRSRFEDSRAGETAFLDHVAACIAGGVKMIQFREKRTVPARKIMSLARELRTLTQELDARLIIHERVDIAKAVHADGVHLGPDDMDPHSARKILGHEYIIGVSAHSQTEAELALRSEIDYLCAGPVFPSEMVPGQPPIGARFIQWMEGNTAIPWYAAGGIDLTTLPEVLANGGRRVALTRCLMASPSPQKDAQKLAEALCVPEASLL